MSINGAAATRHPAARGLNIVKSKVCFGPCTPPSTTWHHDVIMLIATDLDPKALQAGLTLDQFMDALKGHAKDATEIVGLCKDP